MPELRPGTDPVNELRRVRGVLHSLLEFEPLSKHAKQALQLCINVSPTVMYKYLYECAEHYNPYKRDNPKWRKLCMVAAATEPKHLPAEHIKFAQYAATFYYLSEGLYSQPRLPVLTY